MSGFESFLEKAVSAADLAGRKTGEMISYSKLKIRQAKDNNRLSDAYESLGSLCYSEAKGAKHDDEAFCSIITLIDEIKRDIEETERLLASAGDKSVCPACGALAAEDDLYCPKCGAKLGI